MLRHRRVYFPCELNKARMAAVFARLPSQGERIDRNGMAAESGSGIKWHEAERFGFRGFDDFPNIDSHCAINELELVHQGNVYRSKNVLEEFGRLRRSARADRHEFFNCDAVKCFCFFKTGG